LRSFEKLLGGKMGEIKLIYLCLTGIVLSCGAIMVGVKVLKKKIITTEALLYIVSTTIIVVSITHIVYMRNIHWILYIIVPVSGLIALWSLEKIEPQIFNKHS
jgi:hypothetical protein